MPAFDVQTHGQKCHIYIARN